MDNVYRIKEFGKRIGKSCSTLRRWDKEGRLKPKRGLGGHRFYDEADIRVALFQKTTIQNQLNIVYCRVSSKSQKDDLATQHQAMEHFCLGAGIPISEIYDEVAGGMNFNRKIFLSIIDKIEQYEVSKLVVAHKDRLVRFGFAFFEHFAKKHGCEIIVANQINLSPQQEMVEDLMSIVHCFSSRLYGLRNYKKQIADAAKVKNDQNTDN